MEAVVSRLWCRRYRGRLSLTPEAGHPGYLGIRVSETLTMTNQLTDQKHRRFSVDEAPSPAKPLYTAS